MLYYHLYKNMFTNNEEIVVVKQDIKKLRNELSELGNIKETLTSEIKNLENKSEYYYNITEKIEIAEKELVNLDARLSEHRSIQEDINSGKNIIDNQKNVIIDLIKEKETLISDIDKLTNQFELVKNKLLDIEKLLSDKKLELENVVNENEKTIIRLNNDIKSIKLENKNIYNELNSQYKSLLNNKNKLNFDISLLLEQEKKLRDDILVLKVEFESLKNEIDKSKKESELYNSSKILEADKYYAEKQEEIINISGELSNKEAILKRKENSLRSVKKELEEFYNRKIDHIVI